MWVIRAVIIAIAASLLWILRLAIAYYGQCQETLASQSVVPAMDFNAVYFVVIIASAFIVSALWECFFVSGYDQWL